MVKRCPASMVCNPREGQVPEHRAGEDVLSSSVAGLYRSRQELGRIAVEVSPPYSLTGLSMTNLPRASNALGSQVEDPAAHFSLAGFPKAGHVLSSQAGDAARPPMTSLPKSSQTLGSQDADAMYSPLYDWPL